MKLTDKILHTTDMHSSLVGMGPASDYTPFVLGDDDTRGGFARLAGLIARRREARAEQGPVLVLDAGDFSMGTPFGAASRETGGELQLMSLMGYDATTTSTAATARLISAGRTSGCTVSPAPFISVRFWSPSQSTQRVYCHYSPRTKRGGPSMARWKHSRCLAPT